MKDKVQKIREEVARLKLCTMDEHMKFYSECAEAEYNALCKVEEIIDSLQEEPVSDVLNTKSMIKSYRQRLISQANGVKNSPLISMCLASYKHGINETLDTLKLSNVERTIKNWKEPVSEDLESWDKFSHIDDGSGG